MKFKFPLQKVLDHRKTKENLAQKDFQDALNDLHLLQRKLAELETALHESHVQAGDLQMQGGPQGPALTQIHHFITNQKILIQQQKQRLAAQEKVVEDKRELLRQAAVETKIISKFKEKKLEEFREEQDKAEQKEMDEQSILRFKTADKKLENL